MKELFQHIERLLTGNDCVVVPGLGGFVLHEVHFSVDEDGAVLHPGGKEISFNVRLTFNDGILVQSYQEKHQLTFEAAVETIREKVAYIHAALNEGHIISVGRLGTLRKNEDGQILFRPDNRNLFCPECYGLSSYVFHTLEQRLEAAEKPSSLRRTRKKSRKKKEVTLITQPSRSNTFSQVLTGIAACFLLLLIAKPAGELKQFKTQEAFLLREYFMSGITAPTFDTLIQTSVTPLPSESTQIVNAPKKQRIKSGDDVEIEGLFDDIDSLFGASPTTPKKSKKILPSTDDIDSLFGLISFITTGIGNKDSSKQLAANTKKNDTSKQNQAKPAKDDSLVKKDPKTPAPKVVAPKKESIPQNSLPRQKNPIAQAGGKSYNLIISSHPSKATATRWLSGRNDSLYKNATIIEGDGRARVSIQRFTNPEEAENYLRQFREEHPEHADAWLLPTSI